MKAYILKDEDFADLARRIELHYRERAERENQPWGTSFMRDDPRGTSIYDQFKSTWLELCRWAGEREISIYKTLNP